MNTRKLTLSSILLAIGLILHYVMPPLPGGIKPDTLLSMMFIAIFVCDDYKTTIAIGGAAGILSALTTGAANGQIPNILDKLITCQIVYLMFKFAKNKLKNQLSILMVSVLGTFVSAAIFVSTLGLLAGLPASIGFIITFVVLPAVAGNILLCTLAYNVLSQSLKRTSLKFN
jgi:hypothetical protein